MTTETFLGMIGFMGAVLLVAVIVTAPGESTEVGRRIVDGLLARLFPPRDYR